MELNLRHSAPLEDEWAKWAKIKDTIELTLYC